jgi:hypothetical protein
MGLVGNPAFPIKSHVAKHLWDRHSGVMSTELDTALADLCVKMHGVKVF